MCSSENAHYSQQRSAVRSTARTQNKTKKKKNSEIFVLNAQIVYKVKCIIVLSHASNDIIKSNYVIKEDKSV